MITNETINQELDRMFDEYGIEFNDFGFVDGMTNEAMWLMIKEREIEIIEMVYGVENDQALIIWELGRIQEEVRVEFYNEDPRRYDWLIGRREWLIKVMRENKK